MALQVAVGSLASNTTITLPAVPGTSYNINRITYSYNGAVAIGVANLLVQFDSTQVLNVDLNTNQGEFTSNQGYSLPASAGQAVTIRLNAVALQVGKLSINYDAYS